MATENNGHTQKIAWATSGYDRLFVGATVMDSKRLEDITKTIVRKFQPVRVVLFGSHARGDADEESDLDLFVEMETDLSPPERVIAVSAAFGLRTWPMDVVVYTPAEVERLSSIRGTLLSIIEAEGKVLYERGTHNVLPRRRQRLSLVA
jgi:predicted nucleotidyltransferase